MGKAKKKVASDERLATRRIPLPKKDGDLPRRPKVKEENLNRDLQPGDMEDNDADTQRQAG